MCGGPRDSEKSSCSKCLTRKSERRKAARKARQAIGVCLCGRPISKGKMCDRCKEKSKRERVIHDKRWAAKGLCPRCGKDPLPGKIYCTTHATYQTSIIMKRYNNRRLSNQCTVCGNDLVVGESIRCKSCNGIHVEASRRKWHRDRKKVLDHYGAKCACCGETTYEFLEVDHIDGDGVKHRKITGRHITSWIIRNKFPDWLRLLCANCNRGIGHYKTCPHKTEPQMPHSPSGRRARNRRLKVIAHYGGKCVCCGESNWAFLEFDHINNDGAKHRKAIGQLKPEWIIANGYPDYLQLLCANCNKAKGLYGN
jgi:hypothetical protein